MTSIELLQTLGVTNDPRFVAPAAIGKNARRDIVASENPATGEVLGGVRLDDAEAYERTVSRLAAGFRAWRSVPAPTRGQVVRAIGEEIRTHRQALGRLVTLEVGKILAEGVGEIQEIVDIADLAVGLSRQLPGMTMPSERAGHRLMEQWLPLGPVGVITAFNFPAAVWGWNAMLAAVCGDTVLWKPSLLAPLTAMACNAIASRVATEMGHPDVFGLVIGSDAEIGERLIADRRFPLISATGSCRMGRRVASVVGQRLGRTLLELGGNNAVIVHEDADVSLAAQSIVFGAIGTAGQRCTTTRRLIVHENVAESLREKLCTAYEQVIGVNGAAGRIGDPTSERTLVGPLISGEAVTMFERAVAQADKERGQVLVGGRAITDLGGHFVQPTIVLSPKTNDLPIAMEETFAPILYVFTYTNLDEAIAMQNSVDQGLSSAIFTEGLRVSERFLAPDGSGSDCGIANVNCGTSGAEIGGAFGGEKDTGGGRESGSDSWKAYMRRQTTAINAKGTFALAQGIVFG
ncbi:MAG: aldehyde dehydrogenase family protein [Phycisphaerales bacterium]|jgi:aldehyde dehydrogenase (NAD+)